MSEDAEAAFGAAADEVRLHILRELWNADAPLSFSELRDRVEVRDSGRFNYHLGKLRGQFVRQTDDGYRLRYAGKELVRALYSGVYTEETTVGPVPVAGECPVCGSDLEAEYDGERGRVTCTDCDTDLLSSGLPPGFVDGREDDLPGALDGYLRTTMREFLDGFCSACLGPTTGRLEDSQIGPIAVIECDRCGNTFQGAPGVVALDHPAVVAFCFEHGRDIRDVPVWELDWFFEAEWRGDDAAFTIALDGDELRLTVTDSLDVYAERA